MHTAFGLQYKSIYCMLAAHGLAFKAWTKSLTSSMRMAVSAKTTITANPIGPLGSSMYPTFKAAQGVNVRARY